MPRGPRLDAPGVLHHVMARGIMRQRIFGSLGDVPTLLTLRSPPPHVARVYGQEVGEGERRRHRPSEARQVAIYAARRLAGEELRALGHRFGLGYTTVSRRVGAVARRMEHDPRFRRKVERILTSKVKT